MSVETHPLSTVSIAIKSDDIGIGRAELDIVLTKPDGTDITYPYAVITQIMSINYQIEVGRVVKQYDRIISERKRVDVTFTNLRGGTRFGVIAVLQDAKTGKTLKVAKSAFRTRGDPNLSYSGGYKGNIVINEKDECIGITGNVEQQTDITAPNTSIPDLGVVPDVAFDTNEELQAEQITNTNMTQAEAAMTYPEPYTPSSWITSDQALNSSIGHFDTSIPHNEGQIQTTSSSANNGNNGKGIGALLLLLLLGA